LVVETEGARVIAVAETRRVIGGLGVALLIEEVSDVEAFSRSARFADKREVVRGDIGEDERAVAEHLAVQSYSMANV
jgi:hypothetical protein